MPAEIDYENPHKKKYAELLALFCKLKKIETTLQKLEVLNEDQQRCRLTIRISGRDTIFEDIIYPKMTKAQMTSVLWRSFLCTEKGLELLAETAAENRDEHLALSRLKLAVARNAFFTLDRETIPSGTLRADLTRLFHIVGSARSFALGEIAPVKAELQKFFETRTVLAGKQNAKIDWMKIIWLQAFTGLMSYISTANVTDLKTVLRLAVPMSDISEKAKMRSARQRSKGEVESGLKSALRYLFTGAMLGGMHTQLDRTEREIKNDNSFGLTDTDIGFVVTNLALEPPLKLLGRTRV